MTPLLEKMHRDRPNGLGGGSGHVFEPEQVQFQDQDLLRIPLSRNHLLSLRSPRLLVLVEEDQTVTW